MARANGAAASLSPEAFRGGFGSIQPLILEEWPAIDPVALDATGGDLDRVVDLVADKTEHTKALVRRHLEELQQLAGKTQAAQTNRLEKILERLDERTQKITHELKDHVIPEAKAKIRENLVTSLLVALGLGFVFGIFVGSSRGR